MTKFAGLVIHIKAGDKFLSQYADPSKITPHNPLKPKIKYIEAVTGSHICVHISVRKKFEWYTADGLWILADFNNQPAETRLDRKWNANPDTDAIEMEIAQREMIDEGTGVWSSYKFAFEPLQGARDDHADTNVGQEQHEISGSIVVEVRRVKFYKVKEKHKKYPRKTGPKPIHQLFGDQLSERAIENTIQLVEQKTIDEPSPDEFGCQGIRNSINGSDDRGSTMRFEFRYRSRRTLEALGCILRRPAPVTTGAIERSEPAARAPLASSAAKDRTEQPQFFGLAHSPPRTIAPATAPMEPLKALQTGVTTSFKNQPERSQAFSRVPLPDYSGNPSSPQSEVNSDRESVVGLLQEQLRHEQDNQMVDFSDEEVQRPSRVKEEGEGLEEGFEPFRRTTGRAEARRAVIEEARRLEVFPNLCNVAVKTEFDNENVRQEQAEKDRKVKELEAKLDRLDREIELKGLIAKRNEMRDELTTLQRSTSPRHSGRRASFKSVADNNDVFYRPPTPEESYRTTPLEKTLRRSYPTNQQPSLKRGRSPDQRVSTTAKYNGSKARATVIDLTEN
ncbi:MAG: hypothetical protein M1830_003308 [Pleopsidium flavum]|nr:MAG: hypothetical protein M1830_003308 [Pleopsidium flavum]